MNSNDREEYRNFGRLRNQVIHMSMASTNNLAKEALIYSIKILNPLVQNFWGKSVVDFVKMDPQYHEYFYRGEFEMSVRKFFTMNEGLRKFLGEDSKKGWEELEEFYRQAEEQNREREITEEELAGMHEAAEYSSQKEEIEWREEREKSWQELLNSF